MMGRIQTSSRPAGNGAYATEVIAETVLGSAAASIDFTSIPATYSHLTVHLLGNGDDAAATVALGLRFNGDTGGNYDASALKGNGSTATAASAASQTSAQIAELVATGTAAGGAQTALTLDIPGYASTTFRKSFTTTSFARSTSSRLVQVWSGMWNSTAAINQVTLLAGAGNFKAGTIVTLYGKKGA